MKFVVPDNTEVFEAIEKYKQDPTPENLERVRVLGVRRRRTIIRAYPGVITLNLATQIGHCLGERLYVYGVPFEAVRDKTSTEPYTLSQEPDLAVRFALESLAVVTY